MKKVLIAWGFILICTALILMALPEPIEIPAPNWEPIPIEEEQEEPEEEPVKTSQYVPREFTYEEAQMLMRIAQAEAGNQGIEGMIMVMAVVLNRVEDEDFPNTIEEVIFQPHQFQPIADGRYYEVELSPEVHKALASIEMGEPIAANIVAFEIKESKKLERYFDYAYTVKDHSFYSKKGE